MIPPVPGLPGYTPESRSCHRCGKPMVVRTNRNTGDKFWGCSAFPDCRFTVPLGAPDDWPSGDYSSDGNEWYDDPGHPINHG